MNIIHKILFGVALLALPSFGALQAGSSPSKAAITAEVRLIDAVSVKAPSVTLGQIASITTNNEALRARLNALTIMPVPNLSAPGVVSAYKVKSLLEREGLGNSTIVYGTQSLVTTECREVNAIELRDLITIWVKANSSKDVDSEISFDYIPKKWKVPSDHVEIDISNGRGPLRGPVTFSIRALVADKVMATTQVRGSIAIFKEVVTLNHSLQKGEKLSAASLKVQRAEVTKLGGMEVASSEDVVGMVAKKNLPQGQIIIKADFDQPTLIEKGALSRIIIENGDLKMSIVGAQALQNGKKGDVIPFVNPLNSKDTLHAQVVEVGVAVIRLN